MSRSFRHSSVVAATFAIAVALPFVGSPTAWAAQPQQEDESKAQSGPNDSFRTYLDREVHPTAQDTCTPGFIWQGAGNPSTTFQRKRNLDAGVELAIKGIIRQGADIPSTYVDKYGLVHIEVPSGAQPSNPARAAWNFTYSYDVALDPANPTLENWDAELWIDLDPAEKTDYLKLKLVKLGAPVAAGPCPREPDYNGYGWQAKNTTIIPDDEGTDRVTQNSQNLAFYSSFFNPPYAFGPGQFDVVMIIKRKGGGEDTKTVLHVVFDVVSTPTQTP
jgi:hypothetical protein